MNLKLTLEYDGTGFRGWARQPGLRTVEGVLRDALDALFPRWEGLAVAGRTDSGVHATGQVASVRVEGGPPRERVLEALNAALPEDVAVLEAVEASEDFDARFSARSRSYRYRVVATRSALDARRALLWPRPMDVGALQAAALLLHGEHDFRAFTLTQTRHDAFVRTVLAAGWEQDGRSAWSSRSRPTAFSGTWCGRSSARCSRPARMRPTGSRTCSRDGRARRPG